MKRHPFVLLPVFLLALVAAVHPAISASRATTGGGWPTLRGGAGNSAQGSGSGASPRTRWSYSPRFASLSDAVVGPDGTVYATLYTGDLDEPIGYLVALASNDGRELWKTQMSSWPEGVLALGPSGNLLVATQDGKLGAWDSSTGQLRWQQIGLGGSAPINVAPNGLAYLGSFWGGTISAVDESSGVRKWELPGDWSMNLWDEPAIGPDGTVYIEATDPNHEEAAHVLAMDGQTGQLKWDFALPAADGALIGPVVGKDGTLFCVGTIMYARDPPDSLYALDPANGRVRWSRPFASGIGAPAVGADGTLFVAADGLYALDPATGKTKWHNSSNSGWPSVDGNGTVYVAMVDGAIHALDGSTGTERWHFAVSGDPSSLMVSRDGALAFVSRTNSGRTLYLLDNAPVTSLPAPPTNLTASLASPTSINLAWTDNSNNETDFQIERRVGTAPFAQLAVVPASTVRYTDSGVSPGTSYTYRVRARNPVGFSAVSNEASASTPGAISIREARMISNHEFRVVTRQQTASAGTVRLRWPFPAVPPQPVAAGASSATFIIDLQKRRVPRFVTTQHLTISATLSHGAKAEAKDSQDATIPLPVVTVHGIQVLPPVAVGPMWGHFPALEDALVEDSYQGSHYDAFGAYARYEDNLLRHIPLYPTMFAFTWSSDGLDFVIGAEKLRAYIVDPVFSSTYADKVILIGHSRGANLCRYFISSTVSRKANEHPYCAGAILACDPALGAVPVLHLPLAPRTPDIPPFGAADLFPTWPWTRLTPFSEFTPTDNQDLLALNALSRPKSIPMIALYGYHPDSMNTAATLTGLTYTHTRGDGYVTIYSAQGLMIKPRKDGTFDEPTVADQVPWFRSPTPMPVQGFRMSQEVFLFGLHTGFLDQPEVQDFISAWLESNAVTRR